MTVAELIKFLESCDKNAKVAVQYRDDGGEYYGYDEELYLSQKENLIVF